MVQLELDQSLHQANRQRQYQSNCCVFTYRITFGIQDWYRICQYTEWAWVQRQWRESLLNHSSGPRYLSDVIGTNCWWLLFPGVQPQRFGGARVTQRVAIQWYMFALIMFGLLVDQPILGLIWVVLHETTQTVGSFCTKHPPNIWLVGTKRCESLIWLFFFIPILGYY